MAAAPSTGRAAAVEAPPRAREAELTQALYERYSHQLYGFCFAKLGSREEAEDAVQTTFLNAFRALERGVVPQAESAWLFKIAENVCLSRHRSSFRRRRVESPSDLELLQDLVPAREPGGDELVGLEHVLAKMPQSQRRAILLREWQGLSYREIAVEMELTQPAVETLIFRARRSLAQGLESLDEPERKPLRRRVRRGADAGGLIAALKTFGTAAGMKTAATVVAVGSATVIAATPPSIRHELSRGVQQVWNYAPAAVHDRDAAARAAPVAAAASVASTVAPEGAGSAALDGALAPVLAHPAAHTHPLVPALLAARRAAPRGHRPAPVEAAFVAAAPTAALAPEASAAAPAAVAPTAPAAAALPVAADSRVSAPLAQPVHAPAPATAPAVEPRNDATALPLPAQQPVILAPSRGKDDDNGRSLGRDTKRDNPADNGHGGQKKDARTVASVPAPLPTTGNTVSTSPTATPVAPPSASAPALTTSAAAAPAAPAVTTAAPAPALPADQGHRGRGDGKEHEH